MVLQDVYTIFTVCTRVYAEWFLSIYRILKHVFTWCLNRNRNSYMVKVATIYKLSLACFCLAWFKLRKCKIAKTPAGGELQLRGRNSSCWANLAGRRRRKRRKRKSRRRTVSVIIILRRLSWRDPSWLHGKKSERTWTMSKGREGGGHSEPAHLYNFSKI